LAASETVAEVASTYGRRQSIDCGEGGIGEINLVRLPV